MTSAFCVDAMNQASSPNLPNLYLDRRKSLGKPHATETRCGLTLAFGSTSVEKPLFNARDTSRVVQQIDCIFTFLLFRCVSFTLFAEFYFYCECFFFLFVVRVITQRIAWMANQLQHQVVRA